MTTSKVRGGLHPHTHIYIYIYIHTRAHTYARTHAHTYIHTHALTHTLNILARAQYSDHKHSKLIIAFYSMTVYAVGDIQRLFILYVT